MAANVTKPDDNRGKHKFVLSQTGGSPHTHSNANYSQIRYWQKFVGVLMYVFFLTTCCSFIADVIQKKARNFLQILTEILFKHFLFYKFDEENFS